MEESSTSGALSVVGESALEGAQEVQVDAVVPPVSHHIEEITVTGKAIDNGISFDIGIGDIDDFIDTSFLNVIHTPVTDILHGEVKGTTIPTTSTQDVLTTQQQTQSGEVITASADTLSGEVKTAPVDLSSGQVITPGIINDLIDLTQNTAIGDIPLSSVIGINTAGDTVNHIPLTSRS